eukprot:5562342-Prorocentrum_lima.AAC.1
MSRVPGQVAQAMFGKARTHGGHEGVWDDLGCNGQLLHDANIRCVQADLDGVELPCRVTPPAQEH